MGCDTERTDGSQEFKLHIDQPEREEKTRQRHAEDQQRAVLSEKLIARFVKKHDQDRRIPNDAKHRHRNSVHFREAAGVHGGAIARAEAHSVIARDLVDRHIDRYSQTDDHKRDGNTVQPFIHGTSQ